MSYTTTPKPTATNSATNASACMNPKPDFFCCFAGLTAYEVSSATGTGILPLGDRATSAVDERSGGFAPFAGSGGGFAVDVDTGGSASASSSSSSTGGGGFGGGGRGASGATAGS